MTIIESPFDLYETQRNYNGLRISSYQDTDDDNLIGYSSRTYSFYNLSNENLFTDNRDVIPYNNQFYLTPTAINLSEKLINIPGIIHIHFSNNGIILYKVNSFDWIDLHPYILSIIEGNCNYSNFNFGDLTDISFVENYYTTQFIIVTKLRLLKAKNNNAETFMYTLSNTINNWRGYQFKNLTRKGKFFISLFKEICPYDFFRLSIIDYRIIYQILNFSSNTGKERNRIHSDLISHIKMILQRIQIGITT